MKRVLFASVLLLLLSILALPEVTIAEGIGPSANGSFTISLENGQSRYIQFDARVGTDGNTNGEIVFHDGREMLSNASTTSDVEASESQPAFYAKAMCDCLLVDGVEAVLGGVVTESSHKNFIGRRVLLAVQDGDSLTPQLRDKLTFGFYRTTFRSWVATDRERPEEQVFTPAWVAKDAERDDDIGTLSYKSEEITCNSFPLSSHSFIGAKQGKGKIQVTH